MPSGQFEGAKLLKKWRPSENSLHFFKNNGLIIKLSHDDFPSLYVVAVDQAQHIHASGGERRNNVSVLSRTE